MFLRERSRAIIGPRLWRHPPMFFFDILRQQVLAQSRVEIINYQRFLRWPEGVWYKGFSYDKRAFWFKFLRWEKGIMLQKWTRFWYDRRYAYQKFPQWQETPFSSSPSNHSKGDLSVRPFGHVIWSGSIIEELLKGARQLQWSKSKQSWVPSRNKTIELRMPGSCQKKTANQKSHVICYMSTIHTDKKNI